MFSETLKMYQFDNSEEIKEKAKAKLLMLTAGKNGTYPCFSLHLQA